MLWLAGKCTRMFFRFPMVGGRFRLRFTALILVKLSQNLMNQSSLSVVAILFGLHKQKVRASSQRGKASRSGRESKRLSLSDSFHYDLGGGDFVTLQKRTKSGKRKLKKKSHDSKTSGASSTESWRSHGSRRSKTLSKRPPLMQKNIWTISSWQSILISLRSRWRIGNQTHWVPAQTIEWVQIGSKTSKEVENSSNKARTHHLEGFWELPGVLLTIDIFWKGKVLWAWFWGEPGPETPPKKYHEKLQH